MKRHGKKKTSPEQLTILVNFISKNKVLVPGKTKPLEDEKKIFDNLWEDLTKQLNSIGQGPSKTSSQWRKTFIDWKCHTKKKARDLQKDKQKTEGGSFITKGLTPTEEKLISFLTCISEEGADVDEVGLGNETVDVEFQTAHVFAEMPINQQSSKRPHSPPVVERKRLCTDSETPRTEEKTGKASNLQKADDAFQAVNKNKDKRIEKIWQTNFLDAMIELELKEVELKRRLLEARNKTKELELLERKLKLEEAKFTSEQKT
ncbi:myb/SANT-like DNA-binding domain-containing protein 4 [Harmonia axyridis]|uniref:myb/SANT-like DNA-binding domain-containing protein 4 n=1 Tax=Harmonia axyridis TaxID=115357 RepID=UPI001E27867A|nr:myb/SANT-like DNA-binding domain-containing protein 4 [Harmonia axyridis]